jgi:LysR family glycine cleavage system transcriptional activator
MPGEFSDVHEVLIRPQVFAVCSPAFRQTLPVALTVADLSACKLIHVDSGAWWNSWFAAQGVHECVEADTSHVSNDVVLTLAKAGHGIALATDVLVGKELAEGSLVRCVAQGVALESYQVLVPTQAPNEETRWFIHWIRESLRSDYPQAVEDMHWPHDPHQPRGGSQG